MGPALITIPLFWGVYWPIYDHVKVYVQESDFFFDKFMVWCKKSWLDNVMRSDALSPSHSTAHTASSIDADARYAQIYTHLVHITSAICAGAMADIITNPFWVTRTRIQTLALHTEENMLAYSTIPSPSPSHPSHIPKSSRSVQDISTYQMMRHIHRQEGLGAFYRGLTASFLGLSHVAIQFPLCKDCVCFNMCICDYGHGCGLC
ncbi:solute carrier family 25 protein [archaeon]|nr:MAG: solute carrier family 25 protein [archaeon]